MTLGAGAQRERARMYAIGVAQSVYYRNAPLKAGVARVKADRPPRSNDPLGLRNGVSDRVIARKMRRKRLSRSPAGFRRLTKRKAGALHAESKGWLKAIGENYPLDRPVA